jgi:hypothetical protein
MLTGEALINARRRLLEANIGLMLLDDFITEIRC